MAETIKEIFNFTNVSNGYVFTEGGTLREFRDTLDSIEKLAEDLNCTGPVHIAIDLEEHDYSDRQYIDVVVSFPRLETDKEMEERLARLDEEAKARDQALEDLKAKEHAEFLRLKEKFEK